MKLVRIIGLVITVLLGVMYANAQSTTISYQGNLNVGSTPATGNFDFEFRLFDALSGGTQLGPTVSRNAVAVANGNFSVNIDFGSSFPGAQRYLEIRVRTTGSGGFTILDPRQPILSTPYSIKSINSDSATNATTATNAQQLGGVAANQYVLTGDPRMTDARNPLPNSANYIQNAIAQQPASFNISGNGTAAGILSGGIVNAATHYRINNISVLAANGKFVGPFTDYLASNTFVGDNAGASTTPDIDLRSDAGKFNSFFGITAGQTNTTGRYNTFSGAFAGLSTSTGSYNSFYGYSSGIGNATGEENSFFGFGSGQTSVANVAGFGNSFFGSKSGSAGSNGNYNTLIGISTLLTSSGLENATAVGARASVGQSNSLVLGATAGVNSATTTTKVGIGTTAPLTRLDVRGDVFVGLTTPPNASFLNSLFLANDVGDVNNSFRLDAAQNNLYIIGRSAPGAAAGAGIIFRTGAAGGTEVDRVIIDPNGSVGIGTTVPAERLHVAANGGNLRIGGLDCAAPFVAITFSLSNCLSYSLKGDGNDTILNAPTSGNILFRVGNITRGSFSSGGIFSINVLGAAGSTALCRNASNQISSCSSSARYKNNIIRFSSGLDLIRKLKPVSFEWRDGGMLDVGLVAEEVAAAEPLLTTTNRKGEVEGVKYDRVGVVLINAVKEQQAEIEAQRKEINDLRSQIESLKKLICATNREASICKEIK